MSEFFLNDEQKKVFKDAGERRKQAGIKFKRICIFAEASQVEAFNILFDSWCERFGKAKALDHLILLWSRVEARLRDKDRNETRPSSD